MDLSVYLVTQSEQVLPSSSLDRVVAQAIEGGATVVQLREKSCETATFVDRARRLKAICDKANVPLLINDRLDVALAVGASGVHIGQDDMALADARRLLPPRSIIGVSAGNLDEALEAARGGADYVGIGACWATGSKSVADEKVLGPRGIKKIMDGLPLDLPAVVIGGINERNVDRTLFGCTGGAPGQLRRVDGVAVISAIMASPDPRAAAARLQEAVSRYRTASGLLSTPTTIEQRACALFSALASSNGVIHHITNTVVQNDCANYTLALRQSPIMSASAEEAEELAQLTPGCLVLNLGTLTSAQVEAMVVAGQAANRLGKGVVCDPVAVGASRLRRKETLRMLNAVQMTIIKGNAGEIATLAGEAGASSRGVDTAGTLEDPVAVVRNLARAERAVVVMTGKTDYVSDGESTFKLDNGVEMLGSITGSGCMTGSSIGCLVAAAQSVAKGPTASTSMVSGDVLAAAVAGVTVINVAAEVAMESGAVNGPNSFRSALIDAVYNLDAKALQARMRIAKV